MGKGFLIVSTTTANEALPIAWANVVVTDENNNTLYNVSTNESGFTARLPLNAPDVWHSLNPDDFNIPYARYNIGISAEGFKTFIIEGVRILDTSETIQHIEMIPLSPDLTRDESVVHVTNGEHNLRSPQTRFTLEPPPPITGRVLPNVIVPEYITVHLARPETAAPSRRVLFKDYIKNVASHEIYDTWPTASLEANIYCIISFTLNRIYTEFYRMRGYQFDITNSTSIDHYFKPYGAIGGNISRVVDNIFNRYLARVGQKEPFLAQYCDGRQVQCPGWLTQWGSCVDAQNGMTATQIIKKYYSLYNLEFREANLFSGPIESYPGYALRQGMSGEIVRTLQTYLNRIGGSFPLPVITPVDGSFGPMTSAAVVKFQQTFNLTPDGIVGKATWYKINQIYVGVKKLSEMNSEGERVGIGHTPPAVVLREGSRGSDVAQLQFLLNFISLYNNDVPSVVENSVFNAQTKQSVMAFQQAYGIEPDGVVGASTWRRLYDVYWGIIDNVPLPPQEPQIPPGPGNVPAYPGYLIRLGASGQDVMLVQTALERLAELHPQEIPAITPDGQFGSRTQAAVMAFQRYAKLGADGIVGPATWRRLMDEYYSNLIGGPGATPSTPPYPGSPIRRGSMGDNVRLIQNNLNVIRKSYPQIPLLEADGVFGAGTEAAVRTFQSLFGLSADGVVGQATWDTIMRVYAQTGGRVIESAEAELPGQVPGININMEFLIRMMFMRRFRKW